MGALLVMRNARSKAVETELLFGPSDFGRVTVCGAVLTRRSFSFAPSDSDSLDSLDDAQSELSSSRVSVPRLLSSSISERSTARLEGFLALAEEVGFLAVCLSLLWFRDDRANPVTGEGPRAALVFTGADALSSL